MNTVRRAYIYLVCAFSLEAVAWAAIDLLRRLLAGGRPDPAATGFNLAVTVIGLPIFLAHWLWAQRLAGREPEERDAPLRHLYLYGVMLGFVIPFLFNSFDLLRAALRLGLIGLGLAAGGVRLWDQVTAAEHLAAMAVMAALWAYHWQVAAVHERATPLRDTSAAIRRLYVLGLSGAGLAMTALAAAGLLCWILVQAGTPAIASHSGGAIALAREMARLIVGLPLWLLSWRRAQRLFADGDDQERASVPRSVYLYLAVFSGALSTVTALTFVLSNILDRVLGVTRPLGGDWRESAVVIVVGATVWAYHTVVLHRDTATFEERPRQVAVRRIYHYLVAAIGLAALLVGTGGIIAVLIRTAMREIGQSALREQAAWFTAALVAGLPVWLVPWRRVQSAVAAPGQEGDRERSSVVRKIYLYFYLLIAALTVLSSAIYIVSRLIGLLLGADRALWTSDLARAVAFGLLGTGVWIAHFLVVRADGRRAGAGLAQRLAALRVAVLDTSDGALGRAVIHGLSRELPDLNIVPAGLTPAAAEALGGDGRRPDMPGTLAECQVIVGPRTIAVPGASAGAVSPELAAAVAASPALKLLVPQAEAGWHWVGAESLKERDVVRQTVHAVRQVASGEELKPARPLGAGAIVGIAIGALVVLSMVGWPVLLFLMGGWD